MKKNVIISLADAKYFDLLNELWTQFKALKKVKTQQFVF